MTPQPSHGPSDRDLRALEDFYDALAAGRDAVPAPDAPGGESDWESVAECLRLVARTWRNRPYDTPHAATVDAGTATDVPAQVQVRLGPFELVRPLGRGGFGLVFLARDPRLDRLVAVKVPRPDVALTANLYRRFVREGRAVAGLDHPNILSLYETGESALTPYIAGAYCPGPTLAVWLKRQTGPVPPRVATDLVAQLANAVQHAHDRGVLHRDLKPGNVMLQPHDGVPTEDPPPGGFTPRLTDFGLARLVDDLTDETRSSAYIGTPSYMAPEQARGQSSQVGRAADVYGLGAILYEVLTGRPPFRGATDADTLRQVVADEPIAPRRERADVPADLEAVCLKCLEKEPGRRYRSAADLAADLRLFLDGRPTKARPLGAVGRTVRWVRRRPDVAGLTALVVATLLFAVIGGSWFSIRHATATREAATYELYALFDRVRQRRSEPRPGWTVENLADLRRAAQLSRAGEHIEDLRSEAAAALAAPELRRVRSLSLDFEVYAVAFSPDGRALALGGWGTADGVGRVRLVDPNDGRTLRELTFPADSASTARFDKKPDGCRNLVFSPKGRWLVAASRFAGLHRWDLNQEKPQAVSWGSPASDYLHLAFGTARPVVLITYGSGEIIARAAAGDWSQIGRWADTGRPTVDPVAGRVAYEASGKLHLLDGQTFQPVRPPTPTGGRWWPWHFGPDGRTMAGTNGNRVRLVEAETGFDLGALEMPGSNVANADDITDVVFSPDGAMLAAASEFSHHVKLWDVVSGRLVSDMIAGDRGSMRLAFQPGGRILVVAAEGRADVYEIGGLAVRTAEAVQPFAVRAADMRADGKAFACLADVEDDLKSEVSWWKQGAALSGQPYYRHRIPMSKRPAVALDPEGQRVAYSQPGGVVVQTNKVRPKNAMDGNASDLRFDPGRRLWAVFADEVCAFAPAEGVITARWTNPRGSAPAGNVCYTVSPGQSNVLVGRRDGRVFLLDTQARHMADWQVGETPSTAEGRATPWEPVTALHLNEHAGLAVAGTEKGRVRIFRIPSGDVLAHLPKAHSDAVDAAALSPDGNLVATGGRDRLIRLWRPDGTPILTLRATAAVTMLAFTPDGKNLITLAAGERGLRRWHLDRLEAELRAIGLDIPGP